MKKFPLFFLIVLLSIVSLNSCGCKHEWEKATCTSPKICSKCGASEGSALGHIYEYGFCKNCQNISDERQEDLDSIATGVCFTYWYVSYELSPSADDMQVKYDSIIPDTSNGTCKLTGYVLVNYENKTYRGNFDFFCKWNDERNRFVRDTGTFDEFCACDKSGKIITSVFSERKILTHYTGNKQAKSVLEFDTDGSLTQKMYNTENYLVNNSYATYNYTESPVFYIITTITTSGHTETMYYSPNHNAVVWDDEAYISY